MFRTQPTRPDSEHAHSLPALLANVRDEVRVQRAARSARKQLRKDLATYTTASEINDLEAALDRYDENQVADIRRILHQQRAA
jgi:hypothetical protein